MRRPVPRGVNDAERTGRRHDDWEDRAPPFASPEDRHPMAQQPSKPTIGKTVKTGHMHICIATTAKTATVLSGRRPLSRVSLKLLRTSRVRSCLRPAGPDEDPPGSSPQSPYRARSGADSATGFQALSVGSHHFAVALDADRLAAKPPP